MHHLDQVAQWCAFTVDSLVSPSLIPEAKCIIWDSYISLRPGPYQPDRGIFPHLKAHTMRPIPSSLICPLLPSGVYASFFYFSNHWAPTSLKLIESETCLPEETLTPSIKEISDFILSIRSKDWARVFNTDRCYFPSNPKVLPWILSFTYRNISHLHCLYHKIS